MDKCLDLTGYFDEDDRIDIQVHTRKDTVIIHDIKPFVNWYDDWFTVEVVGRYATAYYFKSEDVLYFSIVPEQNANAYKWEVDQEPACDECRENVNYAF